MASIPKEIQDGIKKLSEKREVPVKDLLTRLKEIMEEDESIQAMEKTDFKIRVAWAALYKEYVSGGGQLCHFMPVAYVSPRSIRIEKENRLVCDVTALVRTIERKGEEDVYGEWEYSSGTLWGDAAKNLGALEKDKVYETTMILSNKERKKEVTFGKILISNNATFKETKVKGPDFKEFYEKIIEPKSVLITLDEIDLSESHASTDTKVLAVTIISSDIGEKDGNEYAYFEVMDTSVTGETKRIFCDPRNLEYIQGSLVMMGVQVRDTSKKDEETSMRMNFQWVLPTDLAEKTEPPKKEDVEEISFEEEEGKGEKEEIEMDEGDKSKEGDVFEI